MKFGQTAILLFFVLLEEHSVKSTFIFGEGSCLVDTCGNGVTGHRYDGCNGNSCQFINADYPFSDTVIGTNSCTQKWSCDQVSRYTYAYVEIGNDSCTTEWACKEMGAAMGGTSASLIIGNNSCIGDNVCTSLSRNSREIAATVGNDSCIGVRACQGWVKQQHGLPTNDDAYIGNNSCVGDRACIQTNPSAKLLSIGSNSCNGSQACSCLYTRFIRYVPDNTCNGKECCTDMYTPTAFADTLPTTKPPKIPKCDDDLYCAKGSVVKRTNESCLSEDPSKCLEMIGGVIFSCDSGVAPTCFTDIPIRSCQGSWECLDSDSQAIEKVVVPPQACNGSTCLKTDSESYITCESSDGVVAPSCIPPTLEDRWTINYGTTSFKEDASRKYAFSSDFTFSDYINAGMVSYRIYDGPSCGDGAGESTLKNSGAGFLESARVDTTALSDAVGTGWFDVANPRTATITSTVDPTQLVGSAIFDGSTVGEAVIAWCLRIMASTTGNITKEVNFNELVYTVNVDLSAGFNITNLSVKKRDADQASQNVSYDVTACECDGSACVLANEQRNQGDIVTVCVKPKPRATAAGVYMRSIKEFTWERDDVSQPAIAENKEANNLLTSYSGCQGKSICVFTSILFADFYQKEGVVNGSGEAILQFGSSSGSRKLRSLQEDAEVASIADFDLNFVVNPTLDGVNSSGSPAGSILLTTLAAAGTWMMM